MTAEVAARVTERFFRADPSRSRHRGGTGLGLSIVDATVSAHGGAVEIDSEPGSGTTVRLTMPLANGLPRPTTKNGRAAGGRGPPNSSILAPAEGRPH